MAHSDAYDLNCLLRSLKIAGRDNLYHLDIVGMSKLEMADIFRLIKTRTGLIPMGAFAFVLELDPSFKYVNHLKIRFVLMPTRLSGLAGHGADDVGNEAAVGRGLDT